MDALHNLPSFCRVAADLRPTPDSDIRIEVWLPTAQWNGKFFAVGSGGSGGSLSYGEMADALRAQLQGCSRIRLMGTRRRPRRTSLMGRAFRRLRRPGQMASRPARGAHSGTLL